MERERIALLVEVDLDPVPGECHTAESFCAAIQVGLSFQIPHYNPVVTIHERGKA